MSKQKINPIKKLSDENKETEHPSQSAIEADKKLNEIIPKMTLSALPKTPGVYVKLKSAALIKFETESTPELPILQKE